MAGAGNTGGPPEREDVSRLWTNDQVMVSEGKSETEPVALARLKYEYGRFIVVAVSATLMVALVAIFLIYIYPTATPDAQGKIVTAATTIMSAAIGVFVGKKV
jgi:hypothetical protein